MTTFYDDGIIRLVHGDVIEQLRLMDAESVDAIVTDPPYGLEFMGKEWDGADGFRRSLNPADVERDNVFGRTSAKAPEIKHKIPGRGARIQDERAEEMTPTGKGHTSSKGPYLAARVDQYIAGSPYQGWCQAWAEECLRVLKPGGHLLSFGGTRTYHRLATAIEDAGFDIRDCIVWGYASGFPKSLDVAKAIAKWTTVPTSAWDGWGTALKPAWEPIVMARKPFTGTVASNVMEHGTGGLNINATRIPASGDSLDGGRISSSSEGWDRPYKRDADTRAAFIEAGAEKVAVAEALGRWPANVMLTDPIFDGDYPDEVAGGGSSTSGSSDGFVGPYSAAVYGQYAEGQINPEVVYADTGGKSRFFLVPKADRAERERGLTGGTVVEAKMGLKHGGPGEIGKGSKEGYEYSPAIRVNTHPTVKPLDLMVHLVRLVTPPGGTVLDPFVGSGTTMLAASEEGYKGIGIDQSADYLEIAKGRLIATPIGMGLTA